MRRDFPWTSYTNYIPFNLFAISLSALSSNRQRSCRCIIKRVINNDVGWRVNEERCNDILMVCVRPFLNASKRELLADCALPVSVLIMSFFGSYVFRDVKRKLTLRINRHPTPVRIPVVLNITISAYTYDLPTSIRCSTVSAGYVNVNIFFRIWWWYSDDERNEHIGEQNCHKVAEHSSQSIEQ